MAKKTDKTKIDKFFKLVETGKICLSGNYLDMSDFCDSETYEAKVSRCIREVNKYTKIKSYMQADVNGLPIHYAKTLLKNEIKNIYVCVNTHHGMFPVFKKHSFLNGK